MDRSNPPPAIDTSLAIPRTSSDKDISVPSPIEEDTEYTSEEDDEERDLFSAATAAGGGGEDGRHSSASVNSERELIVTQPPREQPNPPAAQRQRRHTTATAPVFPAIVAPSATGLSGAQFPLSVGVTPPSAGNSSSSSPMSLQLRRGSCVVGGDRGRASPAPPSMGAGLPPVEPTNNPRRGSATGSFGLPVPPDWVRSQLDGRRSSRSSMAGTSTMGVTAPKSGRGSPVSWEQHSPGAASLGHPIKSPPLEKRIHNRMLLEGKKQVIILSK